MISEALQIEEADSIPGWMSSQELVWLAEQARNHDHIIEIGSFFGRSTRALGDNARGWVMAIDDWYGPRDVLMSEQDRQSIHDQFLVNMQDLIDAGKVQYLKCQHELLYRFNFDADMVFIDGDHSEESFRRDVDNALRWLNGGGLICGHDHNFEQIERATREILGHVDVCQSIWWKELC